MALPKRRQSKARGRKRRTHYKPAPVNYSDCPQCGSTTHSDVGQGVKRMKLVGWIVLGIVIIALVYYLDLLELIGL